ncbi:MAG: hypothetical protein ACREK2_02240, partial [Gemmatimonadota bacterium]
MQSKCFRRWNAALIAVLALLAWAGPGRAQEPGNEPAAALPAPRGFEPQFIDAESYRDEEVLLYDWPALTMLVRWSAPLAEAIAREDGTLSAELLKEFRDRVGELSEA